LNVSYLIKISLQVFFCGSSNGNDHVSTTIVVEQIVVVDDRGGNGSDRDGSGIYGCDGGDIEDDNGGDSDSNCNEK